MPNELTVMVFLGSDNPLSPLFISQIKGIKDAGFEEHTEVLVHFDSAERGATTKIYNVNSKRKADLARRGGAGAKTRIGDGKDPFVRNMIEDEIAASKLPATMQPSSSDSTSAAESLSNFINFAIAEHEAKNYILILFGHGMIIGNDGFLPDQNPVSGISLLQLKEILRPFEDKETGKTNLQLLALNSCAMSSVELAYQLKGVANQMIATQGDALINSWPYRQMMKKILNHIDRSTRRKEAEIDYPELIEKLYFLCLHNSTDFLSARHSGDLALCSLSNDSVTRLNQPLQNLVKMLKSQMYRTSPLKDLIVFAHWESQSFFNENYTDLYDFCRCLAKQCSELMDAVKDEGLHKDLDAMITVCGKVIDILEPVKSAERSERFKGLVIRTDNFGWLYQYSRGLSIYFPWCEPLNDEPKSNKRTDSTEEAGSQDFLETYRAYDFTTDLGEHSWLSFLESYFEETKRISRKDEEGEGMFDQFLIDVRDGVSLQGTLEVVEAKFNSELTLKKTPELKKTPTTGDSCDCPSIKNFPTLEEGRVRKFSITGGALRAFRVDSDPDENGDEPDNG